MSENEAIERLEYLKCKADLALATAKTNCSWLKDDVRGTSEALQMAISAIEAVQQYRALGTLEELAEVAVALMGFREYQQIGTLEECRAAMEKQKAKRPDYEGDGYFDGQLIYDTWICPCCGGRYEVDFDNYDYCPNCGQKLRWR